MLELSAGNLVIVNQVANVKHKACLLQKLPCEETSFLHTSTAYVGQLSGGSSSTIFDETTLIYACMLINNADYKR